METNVFEIVTSFAAKVREIVPQAEVFAYGSRARNDALADSDLDICVVVPERTYKLCAIVSEVAWEIGFGRIIICPLVLSSDMFYSGYGAVSGLVQSIRREGIAA